MRTSQLSIAWLMRMRKHVWFDIAIIGSRTNIAFQQSHPLELDYDTWCYLLSIFLQLYLLRFYYTIAFCENQALKSFFSNLASKVFWSQKTAGGDSDESPPFAWWGVPHTPCNTDFICGCAMCHRYFSSRCRSVVCRFCSFSPSR